jgi:cation/acetate symporter
MAAKGQNVAHLVGLGYAVAASANLPALIMTLYWRRCSTAGVLAGVVGGTSLAIGMVLVSPNMSYPLQQKAAAEARAAALDDRIRAERAKSAGAAVQVSKWRQEADAARKTAAAIPDDATSLVGLRQPLITLRNPGLVSIPVGFLLVIFMSLLFPSQHSLSLWKELAVRRETGLGVANAIAH